MLFPVAVLLLFAAVLIAIGCWNLWRAHRFRSRGIRVLGLVAMVQDAPGGRHAVLRFRTRDGREMIVGCDLGSWRILRMGQQVTIVYDPTDARRAWPVKLMRGRYVTGALSLLSGICLAAGTLVVTAIVLTH